ncbi:hypothetical protein ACFL96_00010, partial [Thermoproteota archaeon]
MSIYKLALSGSNRFLLASVSTAKPKKKTGLNTELNQSSSIVGTPVVPGVSKADISELLVRREVYGKFISIYVMPSGFIKGKIEEQGRSRDALLIKGLPNTIEVTDKSVVSKWRQLLENGFYFLITGDVIQCCPRLRGGNPLPEYPYSAYPDLESETRDTQIGRPVFLGQRRQPIRFGNQAQGLPFQIGPVNTSFQTFLQRSNTHIDACQMTDQQWNIVREFGVQGFFSALTTFGPHPAIKVIGILGTIAWRVYSSSRNDERAQGLEREIEQLRGNFDNNQGQILDRLKLLTKHLLERSNGLNLTADDIARIRRGEEELPQNQLESLDRILEALQAADAAQRGADTQARRQMANEQCELVTTAAQSVVNLSVQIAAFSNHPQQAQKMQVVGNGMIDVFQGVQKLRTISSTTGFQSAGALLSAVPYVGTIAQAVLSIASLTRRRGQAPEQVILNHLTRLTELVSTSREEMHLRFDQMEKMLSSFYFHTINRFDRLDTRLIELQAQTQRIIDLIDTNFRDHMNFHLTNAIEQARVTPAAQPQRIIEHNTNLVVWARTHSRNSRLTLSDDTDLSEAHSCEILSDRPIENCVGYLSNMTARYGSVCADPINPFVWARAVETYMAVRARRLPAAEDGRVYTSDEQLGFLIDILRLGLQFRDYIKSVQINLALFDCLIEDYKTCMQTMKGANGQDLIQALRSNANATILEQAVMIFDARFHQLRALTELAFNASYRSDFYFRSLIHPDVDYSCRLLSKQDLLGIASEGERHNALTLLQKIISEYQRIIRLKSHAIEQGTANDAYALAEFMIDKICAFGREKYPVGRFAAARIFHDTHGEADDIAVAPAILPNPPAANYSDTPVVLTPSPGSSHLGQATELPCGRIMVRERKPGYCSPMKMDDYILIKKDGTCEGNRPKELMSFTQSKFARIAGNRFITINRITKVYNGRAEFQYYEIKVFYVNGNEYVTDFIVKSERQENNGYIAIFNVGDDRVGLVSGYSSSSPIADVDILDLKEQRIIDTFSYQNGQRLNVYSSSIRLSTGEILVSGRIHNSDVHSILIIGADGIYQQQICKLSEPNLILIGEVEDGKFAAHSGNKLMIFANNGVKWKCERTLFRHRKAITGLFQLSERSIFTMGWPDECFHWICNEAGEWQATRVLEDYFSSIKGNFGGIHDYIRVNKVDNHRLAVLSSFNKSSFQYSIDILVEEQGNWHVETTLNGKFNQRFEVDCLRFSISTLPSGAVVVTSGKEMFVWGRG